MDRKVSATLHRYNNHSHFKKYRSLKTRYSILNGFGRVQVGFSGYAVLARICHFLQWICSFFSCPAHPLSHVPYPCSMLLTPLTKNCICVKKWYSRYKNWVSAWKTANPLTKLHYTSDRNTWGGGGRNLKLIIPSTGRPCMQKWLF